jgi:serine/threonine protein kinase
MTPERWQQIKSILAAARERTEGDLRPWLEKACDGDAELVEEVASFLVHEKELTGFIENPVLPWLDESEEDGGPEAGRHLGPYRLVGLLGEGGMGAVYLAERQQDFEQQVAVKLIQRGLVNPDTIRRFHTERQILARLEHPNIARLLDGGTTDDGVPYLVMERIEGIPIDRYCDDQALSVRQRLELFLPVLSALALAHQNLVMVK